MVGIGDAGVEMLKLAEKVAFVTGASKGIGATVAEKLAEEGAAVVVNYATSAAGAQDVVSKIRSRGERGRCTGRCE
jgi:3-oxoacyl-[acyl-carrier protein] reductase